MPRPIRTKPNQRIRPKQTLNENIIAYFGIVNASGLSVGDKSLVKEKILEQMVRKNEFLVEEGEEVFTPGPGPP